MSLIAPWLAPRAAEGVYDLSLRDQHLDPRLDRRVAVAFGASTVSTTNFGLGPEVATMSDEAILERFNETMRARDEAMAEYEHVAIEIPIGKPQIKFFELAQQWTPRGDVLRCVIEDGGIDGDPVIHIDDQELSWKEFGGLLKTHAGWGMRVVFVPDDELHEAPEIEVGEPGEAEP